MCFVDRVTCSKDDKSSYIKLFDMVLTLGILPDMDTCPTVKVLDSYLILGLK